ncbi:hypothetical protein KSX_02450 [Ktedonospora formicarum]|uniref:6-phosphogluconolactonase n=1 Tax=Ktedonospora formicarum TaxID=2778364 RepID=A0A8J3HWQ6_9CHLR|nr:beta-propeller fold lactonase family protein [Ktedonospora formicarum]GHO42082.1 hypothetical protein KSX_02450 [Ktedonospora formicarum]
MKSQYSVYVGSYASSDTPGIHTFLFDTATGKLTPQGSSSGITHPSFLIAHPNRRWLYAVSEMNQQEDGQEGKVWALTLDAFGEREVFSLLNNQASGGDAPCHLALDASGKWLVVSNYGSGTVAIFPIQPEGSLGPMSDLVQHHGRGLHPARQEGPMHIRLSLRLIIVFSSWQIWALIN